MADYLQYTPLPNNSVLRDWLRSTNSLTVNIIENIAPGKERVPMLPVLNPPHWEFGHVTWFHEFWVQRLGNPLAPSLLKNTDLFFNSSHISHDDRWSIELPSIDALLQYNRQVTDKTHELLEGLADPTLAYHIQLALYHQDMHNEAFAYMWQTLGYPEPFSPIERQEIPWDKVTPLPAHSCPTSSFIHHPDSTLMMGSPPNSGFIFDNEKWAHEVFIPSFAISNRAVSNEQYLKFIESPENQSHPEPLAVPEHWKKERGAWYQRYFNEWLDFRPEEPVRHVSFLNAKRYCQWAGLRLPTEEELTHVIQNSPKEWHSSSLWEWTDSLFQPFPGFSSDPYLDYSSPWFGGNYQVLKGSSIYTPNRLRRSKFRNFYAPHRNDLFCGFRTCLVNLE